MRGDAVTEQWHACPAHLPFHVIGRHAREHMRPHPPCQPGIEAAASRIDGLEAAEGTLHMRQALL
jgi:hypothetical protein